MTYLDHNATTAVKPPVVEVVCAVLREAGNASSVHSAGRAARAHTETARARIGALCATPSTRVVFTSGATEANNTVLAQYASQAVFVSGIEHPSVLEPLPAALRVPVLPDGTVDLAALERLLHKTDAPALVCLMQVNNETGVIQPVAEAARLAHAAGARLHCDAVQAAGRIPVDFEALGADYLTLSAHKCGGPQGVGALICHPDAPPVRLMRGGGQERRLRAGTENVAGIAGFGEAARLALAGLESYAGLASLRDRIEARLRGITVFGASAPRVANTSCFAFEGVPADTQMMALDLAGFCVSSGSACSSGSVRPSHVLEAMGVPHRRAACALRISLGWTTSADDIDRFINTYSHLQDTWQR